jgi:hypothetical protein
MLGVAARCTAGTQLYKAEPQAGDLHFLSFSLRARVVLPFYLGPPRLAFAHANQDTFGHYI